jgi:hypothetical protein
MGSQIVEVQYRINAVEEEINQCTNVEERKQLCKVKEQLREKKLQLP